MLMTLGYLWARLMQADLGGGGGSGSSRGDGVWVMVWVWVRVRAQDRESNSGVMESVVDYVDGRLKESLDQLAAEINCL